MISEERQDQAIAYLFEELSPSERDAFEGELQRDAELQAFVREMRDTLGSLAQASPKAIPSAGLRSRILAMARDEAEPVPVPRMEIPKPNHQRVPIAWIAVSVALFLVAVTAVFDAWAMRARYALQNAQIISLQNDLGQLRGELDSQRQQMADLEKQNSLSQARVVTLDPQIPPLGKASAVVVWDASRQQGLIKGDHLSGAGAGKDYQLWLIDPSAPAPISAGILLVRPDGTFATSFQPVHPVTTVAKFAISIEATGGAATPHGPIVFIGG